MGPIFTLNVSPFLFSTSYKPRGFSPYSLEPVMWNGLWYYTAAINTTSVLADVWLVYMRAAWWCHYMKTFSTLLAFCEGNSQSLVEFHQKCQWCGSSLFYCLLTWTNCWTNGPIVGYSLKRKCHYFDEIFVTDCTGSCQNDNFQRSQLWKVRQNDNISVSACFRRHGHVMFLYCALTDISLVYMH